MKSTAFYSMGQMANKNASDAAAVAARVRAEGNIYTAALATTDITAFSNLMGRELDSLRSTPRTDGFVNNLNYLQALLRSTGYSKGDTPLGSFSYDDISGLKKVFVEARANGVEYFTWLEDLANKGIGNGTSKYSKDVSTAINLTDYLIKNYQTLDLVEVKFLSLLRNIRKSSIMWPYNEEELEIINKGSK